MVTRIETETSPPEVAERPRVDLNRADAEALTTLPGIGPVLAERIVAYRDAHGPFLFESDVQQVSGIGAALYEDIEDRLTLTLLPEPDEGSGEPENAAEEPGNGTAPEFDAARVSEIVIEEDLPELEPAVDPAPLVTPPPLPATALAPAAPQNDGDDEAALPQPIPEAEVEVEVEVETETDTAADDTLSTEPMDQPDEAQDTEPAPEPASQASPKTRRFGWFWTAILGAVLGAMLGVALMLLIFAAVNGSVDVSRSRAMTQMRGQMNELNVELDAIQGDVSALQGDVGGLRERVQVLSGLTARMEQAEEALETFTVEVQALEDETDALTASLDTLAEDVDDMGETLNAVEEQTEKATTFFEGLQGLMQEIFGQPVEPQGAAPATIEEVDA